MDEVKPTYDDEIDLIGILKTLWNGKWKIIGFVVVSLLGVFGYQTYQPPPTFILTIEIKPITSVETQRYQAFNAAGFFTISREQLLSLYLEQLDERVFFEQAIREYKLLDVEEYDDEQAYNKAVLALVSTVEILSPLKKNDSRYTAIRVKHHDDEKWKKTILSVDSSVSQSVKSILQQRFQMSLSVSRQKRAFDIEDLAVKIDNARADHLRFIEDRLAFLIEQREIAKKLGIAQSSIETQTFKTLNSFITNVELDTPYYFRGYESISKEIELIQSRTNKDAFTPGLHELQQKLRNLNQDKTFERAESLFATTPIANTNDFSAVSLQVESTDFKFNNNNNSMLLSLAVVFGGVIGAFYVLISNAIRKRKEQLGEA
jgi:LPS O-antigen subunit length determinant protein (WzzB/FepE family)